MIFNLMPANFDGINEGLLGIRVCSEAIGEGEECLNRDSPDYRMNTINGILGIRKSSNSRLSSQVET
ncbi:MAG: hypothetical protein IIB44_02635 [Candidatus Marinimicrobia bacterium]|nr:hypothetical protein [Candidatus Neomarinimicrobiota bacterium]